ncbi:hypothetical protein ACN28I_08485 [Archangium gephyra]
MANFPGEVRAIFSIMSISESARAFDAPGFVWKLGGDVDGHEGHVEPALHGARVVEVASGGALRDVLGGLAIRPQLLVEAVGHVDVAIRDDDSLREHAAALGEVRGGGARRGLLAVRAVGARRGGEQEEAEERGGRSHGPSA